MARIFLETVVDNSIISALANNYTTVGETKFSKTKYVAVDASKYEGMWTGKYTKNRPFSVQISNVVGFKATVRYQDGSTVKTGQVLIKDNSFRIGDTKFALNSKAGGEASIVTAVTDPYTGGVATLKATVTKKT